MTIEDYLNSPKFEQFQDEALREIAYNAVELFIEENIEIRSNKGWIDNSQLYSIPIIIRSGGYSELTKLINRQKEKNTKPKNKEFWGFLSAIVQSIPDRPDSLRNIVQKELEIQECLEHEKKASDKSEQNRIKGSNKAILNRVINTILPVYFEHFNCHYFCMSNSFRNQKGAAK